MDNLTQGLTFRGIKIIGSHPVGSEWENYDTAKSGIDAADIIIINGEGSIHHNRPYAKQLLEVIPYAKAKGKKTALINALWEENSDEMAHNAAQADLIYVRDKYSQSALRKQLVNAVFAPDLTFYSNYPALSIQNKTLGISDSVSHKVSEQCLNYAQLNKLHYLPITRPPSSQFDYRKDEKKFRKAQLYTLLLRFFGAWLPLRTYYKGLLYSYDRTDNYVTQLRNCRMVIAARFHTACLCIQNRIPCVAIASNSHKLEALFNDVELSPERVFSSLSEYEQLHESSKIDLLEWSAIEAQHIESFIPMSHECLNAMFDEIAGL